MVDAAKCSERTSPGRIHGRIDSQVPSLGVTAQNQSAPADARNLLGIAQRRMLGGDVLGEGEVKILLPADDSGVGAAIGDVVQRVCSNER